MILNHITLISSPLRLFLLFLWAIRVSKKGSSYSTLSPRPSLLIKMFFFIRQFFLLNFLQPLPPPFSLMITLVFLTLILPLPHPPHHPLAMLFLLLVMLSLFVEPLEPLNNQPGFVIMYVPINLTLHLCH